MKNRTRLMRWVWAVILGIILVCISVVAAYNGILADGKDNIVMSMSITSPSFVQGSEIPVRHTCDGLNTSPSITWAGVPPGTKSLALIADDPDAPQMTWVHWVLYNIPATASGLPEDGSGKNLPAGTLQGTNDWHRTSYGGPCPPTGKHRYYFKLFALDCALPDLKNPTKAALEKAMHGHVLEQASLMGVYQRHAVR